MIIINHAFYVVLGHSVLERNEKIPLRCIQSRTRDILTYRVLQTIKMKVILVSVWADIFLLFFAGIVSAISKRLKCLNRVFASNYNLNTSAHWNSSNSVQKELDLTTPAKI
jgi:hypothetical protein